MTSTDRNTIHQGIAAYFGGTFNTLNRTYQGGPLASVGLGTVRAGYSKEANQKDAFVGGTPGQMSGAMMAVWLGDDDESRIALAGSPVLDGSQNIIAGGVKQTCYLVTLDCYHLSHELYAEDAQVHLNHLVEAIKQHIRVDRTLGGICMDGGETRKNIKVKLGRPAQFDNKTTGCWFTITFEVRVNFIA